MSEDYGYVDVSDSSASALSDMMDMQEVLGKECKQIHFKFVWGDYENEPTGFFYAKTKEGLEKISKEFYK